MVDDPRGVVVMAYHARRYHRQAENLALSLERHAPNLNRTLVTDAPRHAAARLYHQVVTIEGEVGGGCAPKLAMDQHTPYQHTIFLDTDCLVLRDLSPLFDRFHADDLVVVGRNVAEGTWYGREIAEIRQLTGTALLPKMNSGFVYFADTQRAHRVFARARELAHSYDRLGFSPFQGGIADEPPLAIAMTAEGLSAHDLTHEVMASLLLVSSPIRIDALTGRCTFNKVHTPTSPAVPHFAAEFSSRWRLVGAHYRRETLKLRLAQRLHWHPTFATLAATALHGIPCALVNAHISLIGRAPGDPPTTGGSPRACR